MILDTLRDTGVLKIPMQFMMFNYMTQSWGMVYKEGAQDHRACVFQRENIFLPLCTAVTPFLKKIWPLTPDLNSQSYCYGGQ